MVIAYKAAQETEIEAWSESWKPGGRHSGLELGGYLRYRALGYEALSYYI